MNSYSLVPIKNFQDALAVRSIRNECREYMTNYTSDISVIQQLTWYLRIYRKQNKDGVLKCFLFKVDRVNCGFGLLRKSSGKYWITGGLAHIYRSKGFGKILFGGLIKNTPSKTVWLEVLDSNLVAKNLYAKLGFRQTKIVIRDGFKVIIMRLNVNNKKINVWE